MTGDIPAYLLGPCDLDRQPLAPTDLHWSSAGLANAVVKKAARRALLLIASGGENDDGEAVVPA